MPSVLETLDQTYRVPWFNGNSHDCAWHRRTQNAAGVFRNFLWHVRVQLCCQLGENANLKLHSSNKMTDWMNEWVNDQSATSTTSLMFTYNSIQSEVFMSRKPVIHYSHHACWNKLKESSLSNDRWTVTTLVSILKVLFALACSNSIKLTTAHVWLCH